MHLLLIEDHPDMAANIVDFLQGRGHTFDVAYTGYGGLGFALEKSYDAVILDLMLPGLDGLEVSAKLREMGNAVPVLILTARDSLEDKLEGFAKGADDYLVKPFALLELEARLFALVRRTAAAPAASPCLRVAELTLDLGARRVTRAGNTLDIAPIPMRLLETLMRESPRVVSRAQLERAIWGNEPPDSNALRAHLHQLRQAIDKPFPRPLLHTVRGFGYRLADDATL
jgi:DNA-binding response OmpR family regulator